MIANSNDIYNLIKSPMYLAEPVVTDSEKRSYASYNLFNKIAPYERIQIEIYGKYMEIHKYKHMNYEYFEHIRTTNQRGKKTLKRFKEVLLEKTAAIVNNAKEDCK